MQAGAYVAIGFVVTQAFKRAWDSSQSNEDSGVTSFRLEKNTKKGKADNDSKPASPTSRRARRNSEPIKYIPPGEGVISGDDGEYLSAREDEGLELDDGDESDIDSQLQKLWAGSLPRELEEILDMMRYPDIFEQVGSRMPKGVILSGPPGTGKTYFAKCLAQVTHASFFYASASQFDEIYVGRGPQRIRALFAEAAAANRARQQQAKRGNQAEGSQGANPSWWRRVLFGRAAAESESAQSSSSSPSDQDERPGHAMSIIFIDELDALGQRGGLLNGDARHATLSELLTQMDGMSSDSFGTILVIAATNNMSLIDPALSRSGRFDRIVQMPLPDEKAREAIIQHYLSNKPLDSDMLNWGIAAAAKATAGFNCADLKNLVNECTIVVTRDAVALRKQNRKRRSAATGSPAPAGFEITMNHISAAIFAIYNKIKKERPQNELLSFRQLQQLLNVPRVDPPPTDDPD